MGSIQALQNKILNLKMNNQQPKYIYVGDFQYRELREMADMVAIECNDNFMGIEVIRVNRDNHINVTT